MGSFTTIGGRPSSGGSGGTVSSLQVGQAVQAGGGVGFVPMDGRVLSKTQYPDLYAALHNATVPPLLDFDLALSSSGTSANSYSVAFNAASNTYSAVNLTTGAFLVSSDNGASWSPVASPVAQTWLAIYSNGQIFVAAGSTYTAVSVDGSTWTNVTALPINGTNTTITMSYSNGLFHLYSEFGKIHMTSRDGYSWTYIGIPLGMVNEVMFTGSSYIAYGYYSSLLNQNVTQVATSPDAVNWTLRPIGTSGVIAAGAQSNGIAVLVISGKVIVSTDGGITWSAPITTPVGFDGLTGYAGGFIATGRTSNYKTSLYSSADGVTWTAVANSIGAMVFGTGNSTAQVIATNGSNWVFSLNQSNVALVTTDFDTWTVANLPMYSDWSLVMWTGTQYVMLSETGTASLTSPDGINWSVGSNTVPVMPKGRWSVNSAGVIVVLNGSNSTVTACLSSNDNGVTWVSRTVPSGTWTSMASKGTTFVIVNSSGSAASSTDGITWTARTVTTGTWVAASGSVFVTVKGGSGTNAAFSSPDGITWTLRTMPYNSGTNEIFNNVFFNGSVFVAPSTSSSTPACSISSDGVTWTQVGSIDLPGAQMSLLHTLTTAGKNVVPANVNGQVFLYENVNDVSGKKWVARKTAVPYTNTKFPMGGQGSDGSVVIGIIGGLVQKFDGTGVSFSALPGGKDITSATYNKMAWNGSKFIAQTLNNNGSAFYLTSTNGASWTKNVSPANGISTILGNNLLIVTTGGVYAGNATDGWKFNSHSGQYIASNFATIGVWTHNGKANVSYHGSNGNTYIWYAQPSVCTDGSNLNHTFPGTNSSFMHESYAVKGSLVVGVYGTTGYYSEDAGYTWKFTTLPVTASLVVYNADQDIFVATSTSTVSKVLVSKDGKTWTAIDLPASSTVQGIASFSGTVVIVVTTGDWFYSTNSGTNWSRTANPFSTQTWTSGVASSSTEMVAFGTAGVARDIARLRKAFDDTKFVKIPSISQTVGVPQWFIKAK